MRFLATIKGNQPNIDAETNDANPLSIVSIFKCNNIIDDNNCNYYKCKMKNSKWRQSNRFFFHFIPVFADAEQTLTMTDKNFKAIVSQMCFQNVNV